MLVNQEVPNKVYHLHFVLVDGVEEFSAEADAMLYPNPVCDIPDINQTSMKVSARAFGLLQTKI